MMFLGIDYIKSLGRLLLLFKSKYFLAAAYAVTRYSLSHLRKRFCYIISHIFFMYRSSELKNILIFIIFFNCNTKCSTKPSKVLSCYKQDHPK